MTAATSEPTIDISRTPRVPFGRLVAVEWRKLTDTRAGFWLLLITGLLVVAAFALVLVVSAAEDDNVTAGGFSEVMTIPVSLLVPVLAIMSVTSEWSQRTALVTFAHEPHRLKIVLAKLVAVLVLGLLTIVLAIALGALGNVLSAGIAGTDPVWDIGVTDVLWLVLQQFLGLLMAFGLAMLFLSTPATVAVYYVAGLLLPFMVYIPLYAAFQWAQDVIPFIDLTFALTPFISTEDFAGRPTSIGGSEIAALVSAVVIWVVLPIAVGGRRTLRAEIK